MEAVLKIWDETPGQGRRAAAELTLASERITAAELIRRRVEAEVAAHNGKTEAVFQGLVQPTDSERLLNGFRLKKPGEGGSGGVPQQRLRAAVRRPPGRG